MNLPTVIKGMAEQRKEIPLRPPTRPNSANVPPRNILSSSASKFLTANFRSDRGEVDLVFRDKDCLVFVEVKTRSSEDWVRPAAFVDKRKRRLLCQTALDYLRLLKNPPVKIRFDIVEVLLRNSAIHEVRHLANTFPMEKPYRYG